MCVNTFRVIVKQQITVVEIESAVECRSLVTSNSFTYFSES